MTIIQDMQTYLIANPLWGIVLGIAILFFLIAIIYSIIKRTNRKLDQKAHKQVYGDNLVPNIPYPMVNGNAIKDIEMPLEGKQENKSIKMRKIDKSDTERDNEAVETKVKELKSLIEHQVKMKMVERFFKE